VPASLLSFLTTVLAFAAALGPLVFVHELGHFMIAKRVGVKVLRFSIGFGRVIFSRHRGETEYAISAMPLGGYVKMLGEDDDEDPAVAAADPERSFQAQPVRRRAAIALAGPAMNFVFAFVLYAVLFTLVGVEMPTSQARLGGVLPGSPAEHAGLKAGDLVRAIDGKPVESWEELSKGIRGSNGQTVELTIERDGASLSLAVTPELKESRTVFGEDAGKAYLIGIGPASEWSRHGPLASVGMAARHTWMQSVLVARSLGLLFSGRVSPSELGGPIAIAQAAGQQAKAGPTYFLSLLGFLSINLGVLNLLPIPALDGGLLAFLAIEGVLRRPLRPRAREIAQQVGMLLLITLMVFVFYNDIHRLVQG
jgi:regulator of sigma E protease